MRSLSAGIDNSILGNIKYRNNVVTGAVAVDNGNNTYDCYIAGADVAYPNIPTIFKDPIFEVGDAVEILMEYGHRELPVIIGYSKKIVQEVVDVDMNVLVTTLEAYSVTQTTAYLEGRIEDIEGYENVTRRGFYYGTTTGYGSNIYTNGSFPVGAYNKQATGLTGYTTYHFQAYVYDADGDVQTGEDKTMITGIPGDIYISYWTGPGGSEVGYIKSFNDNGTAGTSWTAEDYQLLDNGACVDTSDNVYYIAYTSPNHTIMKYNSAGAEVTSLVASYQVQAIAIANDGYIYTLENTQTDNDIMTKRSPTTLQILNSFQLDPSHNYYGLSFLNGDDFYTVNSNDDVIEMWRVSTENEIDEVAVDSGKTSLASLAVAGSTILGTDFANDPWYVPTNLSTGETDWSTEITRCFSVASKDGYFYVLGNKADGGKLYLGKDSENGTKQWVVEALSSTGYYPSTVAAYPF